MMRMILKYVLYYLCFMSCCGSLENMFSLNLIKISMGGDEEIYQVISCEGKWVEIWYQSNIHNRNDLYNKNCEKWDDGDVGKIN